MSSSVVPSCRVDTRDSSVRALVHSLAFLGTRPAYVGRPLRNPEVSRFDKTVAAVLFVALVAILPRDAAGVVGCPGFCDGRCDPGDVSLSDDGNGSCEPPDAADSPDCDGNCDPADIAGSPDCMPTATPTPTIPCTCAGDANRNGLVNFADYGSVAANFGTPCFWEVDRGRRRSARLSRVTRRSPRAGRSPRPGRCRRPRRARARCSPRE